MPMVGKSQQCDYVVYMHVFPNGKRYVGITCRPLERRWENGAGYAKQPYMSHAIKKYGWENITHMVLYQNLSQEQASDYEIALIWEFNTNDARHGYNVDNGGHTCGKHSEKTKKKISENRKGKGKGENNCRHGVDISGANNPFYGKRHTEESRKKISDSKQNGAMDGHKNPWARAIICDGAIFGSVVECARFYGINRDVMSGYASGRRKISKRFVDMGLCYAEGRG